MEFLFLQQAILDDIFSWISIATISKVAWEPLKIKFKNSTNIIKVKLQSLYQ